MAELTPQQRAVARAFVAYASRISEEYWAAGWISGFEHYLCNAWDVPAQSLMHLTEQERETIGELTQLMGGWAASADNEDGFVFWTFAEFVPVHVAWLMDRLERGKAHGRWQNTTAG